MSPEEVKRMPSGFRRRAVLWKLRHEEVLRKKYENKESGSAAFTHDDLIHVWGAKVVGALSEDDEMNQDAKEAG